MGARRLLTQTTYGRRLRRVVDTYTSTLPLAWPARLPHGLAEDIRANVSPSNTDPHHAGALGPCPAGAVTDHI